MIPKIKADLDEMVFEGRERRYGAYFLRKNYASYLLYASLSVVLFFLMASIVPNTALFSGEADVIERRDRVTEVELVEILDEKPEQETQEEEPPPPPPPPPLPVKQIAYRIPEPTPEKELPEEEKEIVAIKDLEKAKNIGLKDIEGADEIIEGWKDEGTGDVPVVIAEKLPKSGDFIIVQEQPKERNLTDIQKAIGYPEVAIDAGITGSVVARVLVDKKGNYRKHKITKKAHPLLQEAVEKHIHKLKFTPAIQGGKPIAFWVNIPFSFRLQ